MESERAFHLEIEEGSVGKYCILTGDPGRSEGIASFFDEPHFIAQNREFTTYGGFLLGQPVSVCSTGIGGPSAAIAIEELSAAGADTFIRVGTCGGINLNVKAGDLIVATAAVRMEGTSREYAPIEYPAAADFSVTQALVSAAGELGYNSFPGVVQCKDSFYGQHSPEKSPVSYELLSKWEAWKRLGVLGSEMESAALFTVAASLGVRCGTVLNVIWNQERKAAGFSEPDDVSTERGIKTAIRALQILMQK